MKTTVLGRDEVHRTVIGSKMAHLRAYCSGCAFRGERPLRAVAGMIAWSIRRYRRENKFYETF